MGRREWGIGTKKYILMIMNECTQIHMYLHVFTSVFTSVFMPRQTIKTLENFFANSRNIATSRSRLPWGGSKGTSREKMALIFPSPFLTLF